MHLFAPPGTTIYGNLLAYDAARTLVATDTKAITCGAALVPFEVQAAGQIELVVFTISDGAGRINLETPVIDDLWFNGAIPPGMPTTAPTVEITSPTNGEKVDATTGSSGLPGGAFVLWVNGKVTGNKVLPVSIWLEPLSPNVGQPIYLKWEDFAPEEFANCQVWGYGKCTVDNPKFVQTPDIETGTGRFSSGPLLPWGKWRVHVEATNLAGLKGSATVDIDNQSDYIRLFTTPSGLKPCDKEIVFGKVEPVGLDNNYCEYAVFADGSACALIFGTPQTGYPEGQGWKVALSANFVTTYFRARDTALGPGRSLGCPTVGVYPADPPATTPPDDGAGIERDFDRGRIVFSKYGTFFMPPVFVKVATSLGVFPSNQAFWQYQLGVPVEDPSRAFDVDDPTLLFQRFARRGWPTSVGGMGPATPDEAIFPPNTLEIRGNWKTPTLYIERVGGDYENLMAGLENTLVPNLPTIWEGAPCTYDGGRYSCPITGLDPKTTDNDALPFPVSRPYAPNHTGPEPTYTPPVWPAHMSKEEAKAYCHGAKYGATDVVLEGLGADPTHPEWAPTYGSAQGLGFFTPTVMKGLIKLHDKGNMDTPGSHMAKEDNPFGHTHYECNAPGSEIEFLVTSLNNEACQGNVGAIAVELGIGCTLPGTPCLPGIPLLAGYLSGNGFCGVSSPCPSDWNLHLRPLPTYWNHFAENYEHDQDFEIEWECYWGSWNFPAEGDVMRSIYCGYNGCWDPDWASFTDFGFKIGDLVMAAGRPIVDCGHEPFLSEIHPPDTLVDYRGIWSNSQSAFATRAQVWVNAFYPGQSRNVTMWAPPRPTPDSVLATWGPKDLQVDDVTGAALAHGSLEVLTKKQVMPQGLAITFSAPEGYYTASFAGMATYPGDADIGNCSDGSALYCSHWPDTVPAETVLRSYGALWKLWWVN